MVEVGRATAAASQWDSVAVELGRRDQEIHALRAQLEQREQEILWLKSHTKVRRGPRTARPAVVEVGRASAAASQWDSVAVELGRRGQEIHALRAQLEQEIL